MISKNWGGIGKRLFFLALLSLPGLISAQHKGVIKGTVGKGTGQKLMLSYVVNGTVFRDSTYLKKGSFELKVQFSEVMPATLRLVHNEGEKSMVHDTKDFYLEPGVVILQSKDSMVNAVITQGNLNKEYLVFKEAIALGEMSKLARAARLTDDPTLKKTLEEKRESLYSTIGPRYEAYIKAYPDSYFSLLALNFMSSGELDVVKIEPLFEGLSARIKSSKEGLEFKSQIDAAKEIKVGSIAPDFEQTDAAGNTVRLSDFRGKYVLLDFWASWCKPCRQDNPNLVKAYAQYKDKNFTIVGVSLDHKKEAWVQAIAKDGLTWTNLSDLNYFKNKAALRYAIRAVPQNYLIDPEGRIVAARLHGEELEKKLAELLGSN